MRLLLDTHFVVWLTVSPATINEKEWALLNDDNADCVASSLSLWELRLKWNSRHVSGARKGPGDPRDMLAALLVAGIEVLPLDPDQACQSLLVPIPHTDPFDEQLMIQAQQTGRQLLTRDARLIAHPLAITAL